VINIYKHSHFIPDPFGHGGNKRTAQINELLADAGISFHEADLTNNVSSRNKLSLYLSGLNYNGLQKIDHKGKYAIGRYLKLFSAFVKEHKPDLFLWESTVEYNLLLAEVLYKHNVPVIAFPHNIESLVAGSKSVFSDKTSPHWLLEELKYLAYCEKNFTISKEEQWLLSNTGINASYLPYYPPRECAKYLLNIREKKTHLNRVNKKNILLLGTCHNKPTFDGYVNLLNYIKQIKGLNINVAGFGSEQLKSIFPEENIRIWGSVDNDVLQNLIIEADFGVIHQQASSGALTRVPELLLAGLPLLLNTHAIRSYHGIKGAKTYNSFEELTDLLDTAEPEMPPVMERSEEEKNFIQYIKTRIDRINGA